MAGYHDHPPPRTPGRAFTLITAVQFIADLQHWVGAHPKTAIRILRIVLEIARDPRTGIGKPEPLKHREPGHWSRRVDDEHRLIYRFDQSHVEFLSARGHYA